MTHLHKKQSQFELVGELLHKSQASSAPEHDIDEWTPLYSLEIADDPVARVNTGDGHYTHHHKRSNDEECHEDCHLANN